MYLRIITVGFALTAGLLAAGFDWNLPEGFPRPAVPSDNPMNTGQGRTWPLPFLRQADLVQRQAIVWKLSSGRRCITDGRASGRALKTLENGFPFAGLTSGVIAAGSTAISCPLIYGVVMPIGL